MVYLIDTCVFIDHLTGRLSPDASGWLVQVAASGEAATSAVVYHELLFGARTPRARATVKKLLGAWDVLPVDRRVAERAAAIRREQAGKGKTIGVADSFIAATALLHGLKVVTGNVRDFPTVTALRPEDLLPGGTSG